MSDSICFFSIRGVYTSLLITPRLAELCRQSSAVVNVTRVRPQESFVWTCPDVTGWCDVTVSSRQGMAGALTDGSTETFWESGDEDRNKAKWIQLSYPGGTPDDRPHLVCLHIDNTRDTVVSELIQLEVRLKR